MMPLNGRARSHFWVRIATNEEPKGGLLTRVASVDTMETFFDSRMDLLERRLKKHSDKLKARAEEAFKFKSPSGEIFVAKDLEKEVQKFKLKVCFMISASTAEANLTRRIVGVIAYGKLVYRVAVSEGCTDKRKDFVLLRCHVSSYDRVTFRHGTTVS